MQKSTQECEKKELGQKSEFHVGRAPYFPIMVGICESRQDRDLRSQRLWRTDGRIVPNQQHDYTTLVTYVKDYLKLFRYYGIAWCLWAAAAKRI